MLDELAVLDYKFFRNWNVNSLVLVFPPFRHMQLYELYRVSCCMIL